MNIPTNAICTLPYIPVRKEPSETSEMISQLLFGELYTVSDVQQKWAKVVNQTDNYTGWCDAKLIKALSKEQTVELQNMKKVVVGQKWLDVNISCFDTSLTISAGSILYQKQPGQFSINGENCNVLTNVNENLANTIDTVIDTAKSLLSTPYLWGGRSAYGIDCSGLVQTCFRVAGKTLPRDASQQIYEGNTVSSLQDAQKGDLAFFCNEKGSVCHVGILLSNDTIIHASGFVKIDSIDIQGIFDKNKDQYTHHLCAIKRVAL